VKDAISGAMSLQIIVIFMLIVNGYLAFSVNYTKAFRVKNEIISIIEKNEGLMNANGVNNNAATQIVQYMKSVNYHLHHQGYSTWCKNNGYEVFESEVGNFCYKHEKVDVTGDTEASNKYQGSYYSIATFVDMDIPIINKLLPVTAGLFRVEGETSLIFSSGNNSETGGSSTGGAIVDPS